jgi:nifR3 family TIM-barrel protein
MAQAKNKKFAEQPKNPGKRPVKMGQNFWANLPRPFFVLAPMANVTDDAFRKMLAKYGKPDVTWTEFVSADGLVSDGRDRLLIDLKFCEAERPIVAQLFTGHTDAMREAAILIAKLGFDGLDINMGCPDRSVEKQGGGAAMMKDPEGALAVLQAAREGWTAANNSVAIKNGSAPISVKTRIGYNKIDLSWIELLLKQNVPALTIHLRTRKEMSNVAAHWELMRDIIKMRDKIQKDKKLKNRTLIIGNGDIESIEDACKKVKQTGCDGIMIGRGVFGKPWFFGHRNKLRKHVKLSTEVSPKQRLAIMLEHAILFEKMFGDGTEPKTRRNKTGRIKNFAVMKKHFKAYVSGWDGARELRAKLMAAKNLGEIKDIISMLK